MAPTFTTLNFALLIHSFTSIVSSASVHNHAGLHSRHTRLFAKRDVAPPAGWEARGCYTDDTNSRTLYSLSNAADSMTTESCISFCSSNGYPYAGTEYGRECYCAKNIAASGSQASSSDCSFPCAGNSTEICGGQSRLNVYHNLTDTASAKPPAINAGPPGWGFLGCYVDSQQSRTLPYGATVPGGFNGMTVAGCTAECTRQGYQYSGVEYSGECYCGNSLPNSLLAPDGTEGCSRVCNGNTTEYCGGANRLNAYGFGNRSTIIPLWNPIGCYSDSVQSRTLRYGMQVPGGYLNMTIPACQTVCQASGYSLAGLSYSQECFCDNSYQSPGAPVTDGCNMACKGDPSTLCGGSNRLNVYGYSGYTGQSSSSSSSSSAAATSASTISTSATSISSTVSSSSSTSSTTTSSTPSSTATIGDRTYNGCYVDNAYGRILSLFAESPGTTTIGSCIKTCTAQGYPVAGVEYSTQCFCGNALINGAVLAPDTDCNMPCGGNSSQMCGAGNRMSIYSASQNITVLPVPVVLKTGLPTNWTYQGCLAEQQGGRVFGHFIDDPVNTTITGCLSACAAYGYSAGGVQYGEQCFCGDDWDRTNAGVAYLPESACTMSCPGDPYHLCGGPNAFSYYSSPNVPDWHQGTGNSAGSYDFLIGGLVIPLITQIGVNGKVVLTEKHGTGPPNSTGAYELDVSQVSNGMNAAWREMYGLQTDVFCSAGLTLPDKAGRIINIGGWSGDSTFGVRLYAPDGSPGVTSKNDWQEDFTKVSLQAGRWYPSALQLVNGSILVIGGEDGSNGLPVPNLEIVPKPPGGYLVDLDWLRRTDPNNLYPFLTVLPSGNIAAFYYNEARILDSKSFSTIRTLPNIPGSVENPAAGRTYPLEGTSMLLPQKAPYTDPLRVIICGGSTPYTGLAIDNCVTIAPDDPAASWQIERMPDKRVMTCMTALPDGTYMILNGAHQGVAGFGLADDPAHMAMLYDPTRPYNSRFTRMANTTIDRLYHSEAILLLDGRILISGSDPEDNTHAQEYRFETFTPPYLMGNRAATRPQFIISNGYSNSTYSNSSSSSSSSSSTSGSAGPSYAYGASIPLTITCITGQVGKISLMAAVASTHGNSMGQRTLLPAYSCSGNSCTVQAPPNGNVAGGPGWWMLFVLDDSGTPSVGTWIQIGGDPAGLGNWPNFPGFTVPGV